MEDFTLNQSLSPDEELALRRARRAEARQKRIAAQRRRNRQLLAAGIATVVLGGSIFAYNATSKKSDNTIKPEKPAFNEVSIPTIQEANRYSEPYFPTETSSTIHLGDQIDSQYAVILDLSNDTILAEKDAHAVISPASMTKVLTLLVAAEHVEDLDDTFTMTIDITDYSYVNDCSVVGLMVGETVSVRELLYGTILPSGADAALGLAHYVSGSQEAFVELMNEKLEELGLSDTAHFTNCVGLYDENHKCTVYDMALIMKAALDNDLCREVLKARTYETLPTADHPEGQILSNWFLRRIEDKDNGDIEVIGAKTGYVYESGSCAVSAGQDSQGNLYIISTGDAAGSWKCIYDHVALYHDYCASTSAEENNM